MAIANPVPPNAPAHPSSHPKLGKPGATWPYRDGNGSLLGFVMRFDTPDGKEFRPLTCWLPEKGLPVWRWESWPAKRPLYGLRGLAERPSAPVLICEGEKASDASADLLRAFVCVTSPNGAKGAGKADWLPLKGRRVVIWPDADLAGLEYAHAAAKRARAAGAASVAIISPPADVAAGWDAADAVAGGWTAERAAQLVLAARPSTGDGPAGDADAGKLRRPSQRDVLVSLIDAVELWHDESGTAFASYLVNGHRENWRLRSTQFQRWLCGRYYEKTGSPIGSQALEDGLRFLEARATFDGPQYKTYVRVARLGNVIYLDLCDPAWRAIEISGSGWRVIDNPPVKFWRPSNAMRPLPEPEAGEEIKKLKDFANASDEDFVLMVAWAVMAFRGDGPFPILIVNGEQGSGKSITCSMLRLLIDPNDALTRNAPEKERDLMVAAVNSHVIAFDNLSSLPNWLSDGLCRLSTGAGFQSREYYTDRDEIVLVAKLPVMLNGISSLAARPDLAERAIVVHLKTIAPDNRLPEDELWANFEKARPGILGTLLDGVSAALRNYGTTKLHHPPRMADFTKWSIAAMPGLGWERAHFEDAYRNNRSEAVESSFEANTVAVAVYDLTLSLGPDGFEGTATELLAEINAKATDAQRRLRSWPQTAGGLGMQIPRIAPLLRLKGLVVDHGVKIKGERTITLKKASRENSQDFAI
jgi:hypothetical protein